MTKRKFNSLSERALFKHYLDQCHLLSRLLKRHSWTNHSEPAKLLQWALYQQEHLSDTRLEIMARPEVNNKLTLIEHQACLFAIIAFGRLVDNYTIADLIKLGELVFNCIIFKRYWALCEIKTQLNTTNYLTPELVNYWLCHSPLQNYSFWESLLETGLKLGGS